MFGEGGSAQRLMTRGGEGATFARCARAFLALRHWRSDPLKLDWALALVLTAALEIEVWVGHGAGVTAWD